MNFRSDFLFIYNCKGAICGSIAGAVMSGWVSFGTQAAVAAGAIVPHRLNMSVEGCDATFGNLSMNYIEHDESDVFPLYRLSFHWINPIGIVSVLIVGSIGEYHCKDIRSCLSFK